MADEKTFISQLNSADTANDTDIMIIEGEETKKISFLSLFNAIKTKLSLGAAAFLGVANNDTTTSEGYVADARIVKKHGDEIDELADDVSEIKEDISEMGKYYSSVPSEDVIIASGKATSVVSITLPKGNYIITALVRFSANANGYRYINVSTTEGGTSNQANASVVSGNTPAQLNLSLCASFKNETVMHLNAYQNSGSSLTCATGGTFIRAIKIN